MESNEPREAVLVRLPIPMKRQLAEIARLNRRSLSAQCQVLLEQFMSDPLAPPPQEQR